MRPEEYGSTMVPVLTAGSTSAVRASSRPLSASRQTTKSGGRSGSGIPSWAAVRPTASADSRREARGRRRVPRRRRGRRSGCGPGRPIRTPAPGSRHRSAGKSKAMKGPGGVSILRGGYLDVIYGLSPSQARCRDRIPRGQPAAAADAGGAIPRPTVSTRCSAELSASSPADDSSLLANDGGQRPQRRVDPVVSRRERCLTVFPSAPRGPGGRRRRGRGSSGCTCSGGTSRSRSRG